MAQLWDALAGLLTPDQARRYLHRLGDRSRALLVLHAVSRADDLAAASGAAIRLTDGGWFKYAVSERAQGAPEALLAACESMFPPPDLCFFLDLPPGAARDRKQVVSRYEQGLGREGDDDGAFGRFQARLAEGWAALERRVGPWRHLDATRPVAALVDEVLAEIDRARPA